MTTPQQPQPPYGAGPYAQPDPYTQQPGGYAAPQGDNCRICGGFPAAHMTIRGHQGFLVLMRFLKQEGAFCRTCGTALRREMTAKTFWQGWWSPFSLVFFTPFTLIWNLVVRAKTNKLPAPAPGTHGPQPDPGAPLLKRPVALALLIPAGWFSALLTQIVLHL
ncbi:hypothetical protein GCM10020221_33320 [Streptomyces thioluteus]|uniref:Toxin-antitoxin system, toxin component n=1 Tax=Streptomyces thioluteus TaxID=66431 RepID=A0ABN3X1U0_STRTU